MTELHTNHKKELKAVLFDIQRFSVNDGPGIRTNLFFKGCPLRCIWCHNPESYIPSKQLSFNPSSCTGCMACVEVCPNHVNQPVKMGEKVILSVNFDKCGACGACLEVCCYGARSMIGKEYTVEELKTQIQTDLEYFKITDDTGRTGGITLTGGEPMSQFEFIDSFLDELDGIHVCMETSGYAPTWQFEKLLNRIHTFLFDYKVTNSEKHKKLCGTDNDLILKNLRFLSNNGADIVLRLPLISGVNDENEHLMAIAELIRENLGISGGEIMAYHNMGIAKAEHIGIMRGSHVERYDGTSATAEQQDCWLRKLKGYGLDRIKIG
jgi:glycyl-radical enzyme activating protein